MVYIITYAYNAEKTLARAIESIINQTYKDFKYYILDNGSTDSTRQIIMEYANRDNRLVPFYADKNRDFSVNTKFHRLCYECEESDYIAFLDADDEYENSFLEKTMCLMVTTNADMVVAGTQYLDKDSNELLTIKYSKDIVLLEKADDYDRFFVELFDLFRQIWGKLYTKRAAQARMEETKTYSNYPMAYGSDTCNVLLCIQASQKVAISDEILHKYYINKNSTSYRWIDGRLMCPKYIYIRMREFLIKKAGGVSIKNDYFLKKIFVENVISGLDVLFYSDLDFNRKLDNIYEFLLDDVTREIYQYDLAEVGFDASKMNLILYKVVSRLVEQSEYLEETKEEIFIDIIKICGVNLFGLIKESNFRWYINHNKDFILAIINGDISELVVQLKKMQGMDDKGPFVEEEVNILISQLH